MTPTFLTRTIEPGSRTRLWLFTSVIAAFALMSPWLWPRSSHAAVDSPVFDKPTSRTLNGNLVMIGNTLLHCAPNRPGNECFNNSAFQKYVNRGPAPVSARRIFNSSSAYVDLPPNSVVKEALLYWGGTLHQNPGDTDSENRAECKITNDCQDKRKQVLFRYPGSDYVEITATELLHPTNLSDERSYHSVKKLDDTFISSLAGKSGRLEFSVANVQTARGIQRHAGWMLVLIYENPAEPLRQVTLFDGYFGGADVNQEITLKDFAAPADKSNVKDAHLWTFAYEGDRQFRNDFLKFNDEDLTLFPNPSPNPSPNPPPNPSMTERRHNNFFNSEIYSYPNVTGRPANQRYDNSAGIDIHRDKIRTPSFDSAKLKLTTGTDGVTLGAAAIVIEMKGDDPTPTPTPRADLSITKSATPKVCASQDVDYEITVKNHGPVIATEVTVVDSLPDEVEIGRLPSNCRRDDNNSVTCNLSTIAVNDSATIKFTVKAVDFGRVENTALVSAKENDPAPENNQASAFTDVLPLTALGLEMTGDSDICEGQDISYRVALRNNGPHEAPNTELKVMTVSGLTLRLIEQDSRFTCDPDGGNVLICKNSSFSSTDNSQPAIFRFAATVPAGTAHGTKYTATAMVTGGESCDIGTGQKAAMVGTTVLTDADLKIVQTGVLKEGVIDPQGRIGWTLTYNVAVTNTSKCIAGDVEIIDTLPKFSVLSTVTTEPRICTQVSPIAGTMTCTLGTIKPGETRCLQVVVKVGRDAFPTSITSVTNIASINIKSGRRDNNTDSNSSELPLSPQNPSDKTQDPNNQILRACQFPPVP